MAFDAGTGRPARAQHQVVEFYWRPGCPFCMSLRQRLRRKQIPVREVNIWEDRRAAARVQSVTGGNETVPTVFVGGRALVNPGVREVMQAVQAEEPELASAIEQRQPVRRFRWPWTRH